MEICSIRHRGLRKYIERGDAAGVPPHFLDKLRKILSFLQDVEDVAELRTIPAWHAHLLTGDRKGTWALHVSPNWRLTFRVDAKPAIVDLDLEDHH